MFKEKADDCTHRWSQVWIQIAIVFAIIAVALITVITGITDGRVTDRVTDRVTENEKKILELLTEDPGYTMMQLSEKLGVSRKTVAGRLKKLNERGLIERVGSDRSGYWKMG